MNYDAVIEPTTHDGWCGWAEGLPVFGEGATAQDCRDDLESADAVCVGRMAEVGEALPAPRPFTGDPPPRGRILRQSIRVKHSQPRTPGIAG